MTLRIITITLFATLLAGCSLPKIGLPKLFKVTVQQGNVITQEMVDKLKPGMTRSQVAFIMGEPILRNTFNEDRWDYIYTVELPGYFSQDIRMSLFFDDNILGYFTGDLAPTEALDVEGSGEEISSEVNEADTNEVEVSEEEAPEETESA